MILLQSWEISTSMEKQWKTFNYLTQENIIVTDLEI